MDERKIEDGEIETAVVRAKRMPQDTRIRVGEFGYNKIGMIGFVEFVRNEFSAASIRKMYPEVYEAAGDPDAIVSINQLLGVIEVPQKVIDILKEVKGRRNRGRLKSFCDSFRLDLTGKENLAIPALEGAVLSDSIYYPCFHPNAHNAKIENLNILREQVYSADEVVKGYLSRMEQWVYHAVSGKFGRERIVYQGVALPPRRNQKALPKSSA